MPLLSEPELGDRAALEHQVRQRIDPGARCEDSPEGPRTVRLSGENSVIIASMPAPIPEPDLSSAVECSAPFWPEAADVANRHRAHAIVAGLNESGDPLEFRRVTSLVVAAFCRVAPVLGVYVGESGNLVPQMAWRRAVRSSAPGQPPLAVWVRAFQIDPIRGRNVVATQGLRAVGMHDLEYHCDSADADALETVFSFAEYVLTSGAEIRSGQTFGFSADHKMSVEVARSRAFPDEKIVRLNAR